MAFSFFAYIAFISLQTPLIPKEKAVFLTENESGKEDIKLKEILITRDEEKLLATSSPHSELEKENSFSVFIGELGNWANLWKVQASINQLYYLNQEYLNLDEGQLINRLDLINFNWLKFFGFEFESWINLGKIQISLSSLSNDNISNSKYSTKALGIKKYRRFNVFAVSTTQLETISLEVVPSNIKDSNSNKEPINSNDTLPLQKGENPIAMSSPDIMIEKKSLFMDFISRLGNWANFAQVQASINHLNGLEEEKSLRFFRFELENWMDLVKIQISDLGNWANLWKVQASINQLYYLNQENLNLDEGQLINRLDLINFNWLKFFGFEFESWINLGKIQISLPSLSNDNISNSKYSTKSLGIKKYSRFNVFAVSTTQLETISQEVVPSNIKDSNSNSECKEPINSNDTLPLQKGENPIAMSSPEIMIEKKSLFMGFISRLGNWANFAQVQASINHLNGLEEEKSLRFFRFELENWMDLVKIQIWTRQFSDLNLSNIFQEKVNSVNNKLECLEKLGATKDDSIILSYSKPEKLSKKSQTPENKTNIKSVKENHFSLFGDILYFKAIEDSVKYAEHIPQSPTFTPTVRSIDQTFEYKPGFRLGLNRAFDHELWNVRAAWTHYRARPRSKHASTTDFGILATFAVPVWGSLGNSQVNKVKGNWNLLINAIDLDVRRMFNIKGFSIAPIAGIKGGLIDQKINIHYGEFLLEFPLRVPPRTVEGKIFFWGVGPLLGMELGYLVSNQFKFFALGTISYLTGNINTKTFYRDFSTQIVQLPENSQVKIEDSKMIVSVFEQLQLGIDKKWVFRRWSLEIAVGWEVQIWEKQLKLNSMGTFVTPPDSGDLSLYGPFLRAKIDF